MEDGRLEARRPKEAVRLGRKCRKRGPHGASERRQRWLFSPETPIPPRSGLVQSMRGVVAIHAPHSLRLAAGILIVSPHSRASDVLVSPALRPATS